MTIGWEPLSRGDIIDIILPSSANFDIKILPEILSFIIDMGYVPRIPKDIIKTKEELIALGEESVLCKY